MVHKHIKYAGVGLIGAAIVFGSGYFTGKYANKPYRVDSSPIKIIPVNPDLEGKVAESDKTQEQELSPNFNDGKFQFDLPDRAVYYLETDDNGFVSRKEINSRHAIYRFIDRTGKVKDLATQSYKPGFQVFELPKEGVYDMWEIIGEKQTYMGIVNRNNEGVSISKDLMDQRTFKEMNENVDRENENKEDGSKEKDSKPTINPYDKFVPFEGIMADGEYKVITGENGQPILLK